jgi:hypothetical protein
MSHLGAMVRGGSGRWARPASFGGGQRRGQPTAPMSGIDKNRFAEKEVLARGYGRLCRSVRYRHFTLAVGLLIAYSVLHIFFLTNWAG